MPHQAHSGTWRVNLPAWVRSTCLHRPDLELDWDPAGYTSPWDIRSWYSFQSSCVWIYPYRPLLLTAWDRISIPDLSLATYTIHPTWKTFHLLISPTYWRPLTYWARKTLLVVATLSYNNLDYLLLLFWNAPNLQRVVRAGFNIELWAFDHTSWKNCTGVIDWLLFIPSAYLPKEQCELFNPDVSYDSETVETQLLISKKHARLGRFWNWPNQPDHPRRGLRRA